MKKNEFFFENKRWCKKSLLYGDLAYIAHVSDLAVYRRADGNFDLAFDENKGDLLTSEGLENVVAISIGTYARERNLGHVANLQPCFGGWWGDALDEKGNLGGYLYEAFPGKLDDSTARSVEHLVAESLQWLIDDGVAKSIDCNAAVVDREYISLSVTITKPDGSQENPFVYELKWKATNGI